MELNAAQRYVVSRDELAPATPITQGAAALTVLVPLVAWAVMGRWPLVLALAVPASLVIGIAIGLVVDVRPLSRRLPGAVGALLVGVLLAMLLGIVSSSTRVQLDEAWALVPVVAMVVLGLDWYWASRLRLVAWLSTPVVLVIAGQDLPWSLIVAAVWLVLVLGTHGLAERDIARAKGLPVPWGAAVAPTGAKADQPRGLLASVAAGVALGLLVGLLVNLALLLRDPPPPDPPSTMRNAPSSGQRGSGAGGGAGAGGAGQGGAGQGGANQGGAGGSDTNGDGVVDGADGRTRDTLGGPGNGSYGQGGGTGARCERSEGCLAVPGDERIVVDSDGRVVRDTDGDGNLDVRRDGRLGIDRDGDGEIDSYDLDEIIVDADADGRIRIDDDGDGRPDRTEGGSVGLDTNGDGVIDRNGAGRVGIDRDGDGTIDDTDLGWIVLDTDGDGLPDTNGAGERLDSDPEVVIADGFDPNGRVDPDAPDGAGGQPGTDEPTEPLEIPAAVWWTLLALVVGGAAGIWWYRRWKRRRDAEADRLAALGELASKAWALAMLEALEAAGAERGRPRRRDESVLRYGTALVDGPLPDPRLAQIASLVDAELFGPVPVDAASRGWADATLLDVLAQHPVDADDGTRQPAPA
ncbi:MAG: hypothetical protein R2699_11695 [Acidimicrobiales bacterium]